MKSNNTPRIYKKRRSDRTHVIYQLTCVDTNEIYIGLTAARFPKDLLRTTKYRWVQHCYKAIEANLDWPLHEAIRSYDNWTYEVLEKIRGKEEAHARERKLIAKYKPTLNRQ